MKNPPYPGEMVGDTLGGIGISVSDAAKTSGVTRQQLHNVIARRSVITSPMAFRLEKFWAARLMFG